EIVASNMTFPTDDEGNLSPSLQSLKDAIDDYGVSEYTIMKQNGVKIGLFGLMGKEAADDAPMSGVDFGDIAEGAKPVVKQLREEEGVDVVIALSHSGTSADSSVSEDEILADKVSGIDVIISGHSHTVLPEPILVDDTIIVSSGEYGKNLGTLRISPSSDDGWQVDDYEIIPIDEELEEDPDTAEKIEAFKEVVQERYLDQYDMEYDEVLAHSDFAFAPFSKLGEQHQEEPMGNLIGDAYIHTVREMEGDAYEP